MTDPDFARETVMDQVTNQFYDGRIDRDRDKFLRELLRELSGVLEDTVGLEDAKGFISIVGNRVGEMMDAEYRTLAGTDQLSKAQVIDALVDLKRRIEGGFSVESVSEDEIVLVNTACPFGDFVKGRSSLCMMTSNVFGRIAASNLGYARVDLEETIAEGHGGCRVVVSLREESVGREYFG